MPLLKRSWLLPNGFTLCLQRFVWGVNSMAENYLMEVWYNCQQFPSTLGCHSPVDFENKLPLYRVYKTEASSSNG